MPQRRLLAFRLKKEGDVASLSAASQNKSLVVVQAVIRIDLLLFYLKMINIWPLAPRAG
jgi:hypothetical protein